MALAVEIPEPMWTLGDKIAKARRNAGLEQADLAANVGVSRALVSKWERDLSEPTVSQARSIAAATGVSFEWLSRSGWTSLNAVPEPADPRIPLFSADDLTPYNATPPSIAIAS